MYRKNIISTLILLILPLHLLFAQQKKKKQTHPGEILYKKYDCASCHGKTGKKPFDLTQAYKKYDTEKIKHYIMNPRAFGNMQMPVYSEVIIQEEYASLIEYVQWLGERSKKNNRKE